MRACGGGSDVGVVLMEFACCVGCRDQGSSKDAQTLYEAGSWQMSEGMRLPSSEVQAR